jgi:hypothetical protein
VPSCRNLDLTIFYHATVMAGTNAIGTRLASVSLQAATTQRRKDMKIYLLMMLIGALLAATHYTSAREQGSKSLPQ